MTGKVFVSMKLPFWHNQSIFSWDFCLTTATLEHSKNDRSSWPVGSITQTSPFMK